MKTNWDNNVKTSEEMMKDIQRGVDALRNKSVDAPIIVGPNELNHIKDVFGDEFISHEI